MLSGLGYCSWPRACSKSLQKHCNTSGTWEKFYWLQKCSHSKAKHGGMNCFIHSHRNNALRCRAFMGQAWCWQQKGLEYLGALVQHPIWRYPHQNECPSMLAVPCDARSGFVAGFSEFESLFVEVRDKSVALGPRAACALPDTWVSCHYEWTREHYTSVINVGKLSVPVDHCSSFSFCSFLVVLFVFPSWESGLDNCCVLFEKRRYLEICFEIREV